MYKKILILILSIFYFSPSIADVKNNFINSLSDYLRDDLGQNFETVEVELSSGTSKEVVGSISLIFFGGRKHHLVKVLNLSVKIHQPLGSGGSVFD